MLRVEIMCFGHVDSLQCRESIALILFPVCHSILPTHFSIDPLPHPSSGLINVILPCTLHLIFSYLPNCLILHTVHNGWLQITHKLYWNEYLMLFEWQLMKCRYYIVVYYSVWLKCSYRVDCPPIQFPHQENNLRKSPSWALKKTGLALHLSCPQLVQQW